MEFVFDIKRIDSLGGGPEQGWQVRLLDGQTDQDVNDPATEQALLPAPRILRVVDANTAANPFGLFPVPPQDDIESIQPGERTSAFYTYCVPPNPQHLADAYGAIITGWGSLLGGGVSVVSFGRYLFTTLMGTYTETDTERTGLWADINRVAGEEPIVLAIRAHSSDSAINRLPWEMMHAGPQGAQQDSHSGFLAQQPQVSITRQVSDVTTPFKDDFKSPPSVLFVVGLRRTDQGLVIDNAIRPGAEYMNLVRGVKQNGLNLKTHLLLEATPDSLGEAVAKIQPSVVHFTCHGDYILENGAFTGAIQLVSNDGKRSEWVSAGGLLSKLQGVQVVVLNACYTASDVVNKARQAGQVAMPLAVELVKGGIPVVLGMAGEVADDACRLFTRRFYEALLDKGNLAQAAAEGRRGGIIGAGSANPDTTADWGFPVIFTSSGVKGGQIVVTPPTPEERAWLIGASNFAIRTKGFPAFCGRIDYFRWYSILMSEPEVQRALPPDRQAIGALAISVSEADNKMGEKLWGRTWLLHHIAAEAARNGHLPWLITKNAVVVTDSINATNLIRILNGASTLAADLLGIQERPAWDQLLKLDTSGFVPPEGLDPPILLNFRLENFKAPDNNPSNVAMAFWADVKTYLDTLKNLYPWFTGAGVGGKLLILIDDVHLMEASATDLLDALLKQGIGVLSKNVRMIFTYAGVSNDAQTAGTPSGASRAKSLEAIVGVGVKSCQLGTFGRPDEENVAYKQFLYHWQNPDEGDQDRPLVALESRIEARSLFKRLEFIVQGIPGYLKPKGSDVVATYYAQNTDSDSKFIKTADDEAKLNEVRNIL